MCSSPRPLLRLVAPVASLALVASIGCDGSPVDPGASLRVTSAGAFTDTVLALLESPLVVEVRDEDGWPARNVMVRFVARAPVGADPFEPRRSAYVCTISTVVCASFHPGGYEVSTGIDVATDDQGRARVRIQFGVVAGQAIIDVSQEELGLALQVHYTTTAGSLAQITAVRPDTAVYASTSYALGASAADRFGNPRAEAVTLTALDPTVATVSAGTVTAAGLGRGRIRMQAGGISDTAWVSVPPPGRLVSMGWSPDIQFLNRLALVNTDGSSRRALLTTFGVNSAALPAWTPDGRSVVIQQVATDEGQLRMVDTLGGQRAFLSDQDDFVRSLQPVSAPATTTLFFFGHRISTGEIGIFRVDSSGIGADFLFTAVAPAPSPDGSRVAYISGESLVIRDIATGVATPVLVTEPIRPRWSPTGDWLAYVDDNWGGLHVLRPDGSEARQLGTGTGYDHSPAWSPDGQWIAIGRQTGIMEIIRVSTGERLPIVGTWGLHQLSWRP